ncbi:hypothetical protein PGT21_015751 [Puccinia graminis f. sp. tritici]|uniref:Uncharacterized protein n=1 Tax=Puccinia graminis f. sp. tritici TaxID=56615 RepID=A0A5B0Q6F0_PUCGR|nr:hypothetical protein PGT21_015751 [Puccinia graminis f. sp. tritici]
MFQISARLILMCAVALQSLVWAPAVPARGHSLTRTTSIEPPTPEQIEQMNFKSVKAGRACQCHTPGCIRPCPDCQDARLSPQVIMSV